MTGLLVGTDSDQYSTRYALPFTPADTADDVINIPGEVDVVSVDWRGSALLGDAVRAKLATIAPAIATTDMRRPSGPTVRDEAIDMKTPRCSFVNYARVSRLCGGAVPSDVSAAVDHAGARTPEHQVADSRSQRRHNDGGATHEVNATYPTPTATIGCDRCYQH